MAGSPQRPLNRLLRQSNRIRMRIKRWRASLRRLPKGKIFGTMAGLLLTAWILPALSHQWQDRQRAREVQAALITKIGRATTNALVTSQALVAGRLPHTRIGGFNQQTFNQLDLDWQLERAEIESQIEAYFPKSDLRDRWRQYSEFVRDTYWLATERCFKRQATVNRIEKLNASLNLKVLRNPFNMPGVPRCTTTHHVLTTYTVAKRRIARKKYYFASLAVLDRKVDVTSGILRGHLAGFSTRSSDLLSDLLPWI